MSKECPDEHELPKDAILEISKKLLERAKTTLGENNEFMYALTRKFLDSPHGEGWLTITETRFDFESKDSLYELVISKRVGRDQITLSTQNEGVSEYIYIGIVKEKLNGLEEERGRLVYSRVDRLIDPPVEQSTNSKEAVAKIRTFLHAI